MSRSIVVVLVSVGALAASAAVALAHNTPYSWSVAKAQFTLQDSTTIALPATERAALDAELDAWLKKFRPLLLTAQAESEKDPQAIRLAQTYDTYDQTLHEGARNGERRPVHRQPSNAPARARE